jgi:hypothetical protein
LGQVEKFATVKPSYLRLVGTVGQPIARTVMIIPQKKYPFKIIDAKAKKGDNIRIEVDETDKPEGKIYTVTVNNLKKEKGRYFDEVSIKTDSTKKKEIKIKVYGNILALKQTKDPKQNPDMNPKRN